MTKIQKVAVSALIFNKHREFLIVKRADDDDFLPNCWEIPGGKLEYGEEVEEGVIRETKEETGIDVEPLYPLKAASYLVAEADKSNEQHYVEIMYLCAMKKETQEVVLSHEHSAFQWVTFEKMPKKELSEYMLEMLQEIKIHPLVK